MTAAAPAVAQQAVVNPIPTRDQIGGNAPPAAAAAPVAPQVSVDTSGALTRDRACSLASSPLRVGISAIRFETPAGGAIPPELARALAGIRPEPRAAGTADEPIAVVCDYRDRATAVLTDAGYVAWVRIPPQEIAGGTLRLTVVTARLTETRLIGDLGGFGRAVAARVEALKAIDPLNAREVERVLLLAKDVPGLRLQLRLIPAGTAPGDVIGEVTASVQKVSVLANIQNYGSRPLGPLIASARADFFGVTGLTDRAFLAYSNSLQWNEVRVLQAGYDVGLGESGVRAAVRGSLGRSRPNIRGLDLRSRSVIAGADLSAPLARGLAPAGTGGLEYQLYARAGMELLNQRTVQGEGRTPFAKDRLRVFFARLEGSARAYAADESLRWSLAGTLEVRRGASILDATRRGQSVGGYFPSRVDGDPEATVVRGEANATVAPAPYLAIDASVYGQWANRPLLNLEEFALGNLTYGRGYDPGANGGDRVIAARIQPRLRIPDRVYSIELIGFYDHVRFYNIGNSPFEARRTVRSAGGGVRIGLPGRFVLEAIYARPLDTVLQTDTRRPRDRVLVSFTTKLYSAGAN